MMSVHYFDDLMQHADPSHRAVLDRLHYELDRCFYHYGEHFSYAREGARQRPFHALARALRRAVRSKASPPPRGAKRLFSGVYCAGQGHDRFDAHVASLGYDVVGFPWDAAIARRIATSSRLSHTTRLIQAALESGAYHRLISPAFAETVEQFDQSLLELIHRHRAVGLLVASDMPFFERSAIAAFRSAGKPSVLYLHGLPGRYIPEDDNRTDYLVVWGDRIRQHYIAAGFDPAKIRVAGHPWMSGPVPSRLRRSRDRVLVLTKVMSGAQQSDRVRILDRARSIVYLNMAQRALQRTNVHRAWLRVHPSENPQWYRRFLGEEFYAFDRQPLSHSLAEATLVIGPTSTVLLQSLRAGVTYYVFEPLVDGEDLFQCVPPPPFDGSDARLPVAQTEESLGRLLKELPPLDSSIFEDYVKTPFDLSFLRDIIP